ncbi:MAG: hypothetical protein ACAI35_05625 [Candidatus Methylacidiphilales bacterium]|nr:hypothetical protein [Candidatus Methylacidiphilales bacterium]
MQSATGESAGSDGKPLAAMAPAERFRALSLDDSPWGMWRPYVVAGGVWLWLSAGLALPMYGLYTQTVQTFFAALWVAIATPVIAGATVALLLLMDLSAMIGGIGAGEVGTTNTTSEDSTQTTSPAGTQQSDNQSRQALTLPLQ